MRKEFDARFSENRVCGRSGDSGHHSRYRSARFVGRGRSRRVSNGINKLLGPDRAERLAYCVDGR